MRRSIVSFVVALHVVDANDSKSPTSCVRPERLRELIERANTEMIESRFDAQRETEANQNAHTAQINSNTEQPFTAFRERTKLSSW